MFPLSLPYKLLIAAGIVTALVLVGGIQGYTIGKGKVQKEFDVYKNKVERLSITQEIKTHEIFKAQQQAIVAATDEYSRSITSIRKYYRMRGNTSNGSNQVSPVPGTTNESEGSSSYDILAGQCAETTQQVISLQKIWEEQKNIYNKGIQ